MQHGKHTQCGGMLDDMCPLWSVFQSFSACGDSVASPYVHERKLPGHGRPSAGVFLRGRPCPWLFIRRRCSTCLRAHKVNYHRSRDGRAKMGFQLPVSTKTISA
ncbi:unnamed protein product [Ixodes hexagonus]